MTHAGIAAGAAYFPSCAVAEKGGQRRVCGSDEDAVTMAVEAGERALAAWGGDARSVDALFVALRHAPDAVGPHAQVVREALGLRDGVRVVTLEADDDLSGLAALQSALDSVMAGPGASSLVIASDEGHRPRQQAAAAAVLVCGSGGRGGGLIEFTEAGRGGALTYERWHGSENGAWGPDARFLTARREDVLTAAIEAGRARDGAETGDVLFAGLHSREQGPVRGVLAAGTRSAQDGGGDRLAVPGADTGVAAPLVAVVGAGRYRTGREVSLVSYGTGQAVLAHLDVPAGTERLFDWPDDARLRSRSPIPAAGPELSLPPESPFFVRNWHASLRLEAAACTGCGHVVFPPSQRPICPVCRGRRWRPHLLARDGTVYSRTENRFLPAGFPGSLVFVLAELADGFKYWAPAPPETDLGEVPIGAPVRAVLRRFTYRDGLAVYSMKFVPGGTAAAGTRASALERAAVEGSNGME